ncbi:MAG: hypothetical protein BMS9Abin13_290 [Patescibacteria group bacterium]|nr:MAG: hypothetical protein BMS9Abin13_290 [Patescibacteria group bacterium]
MILTGHVRSCPIPASPCNCESSQYMLTGILAIFTGLTQAGIGYNASMAVLSDSLHAIADGLADFWGVVIARRVRRNPAKETLLRKRGSRVIAALLFLGAIWILWETGERWLLGSHFVSPLAVAGVGMLAGIINGLRWRILHCAQSSAPNETRAALIAHAKSDTFHSAVVSIVGFMFLAAEFASVESVDITVWGYHAVVTPQDIDLFLSSILALYMIYLSRKIWKGEEHCHHTHHDDHTH